VESSSIEQTHYLFIAVKRITSDVNREQASIVASEEQIHVFGFPYLNKIGSVRMSAAVNCLDKVERSFQNSCLITALADGDIVMVDLPDDLPEAIEQQKEEIGKCMSKQSLVEPPADLRDRSVSQMSSLLDVGSLV
jgi:hypothetical protein